MKMKKRTKKKAFLYKKKERKQTIELNRLECCDCVCRFISCPVYIKRKMENPDDNAPRNGSSVSIGNGIMYSCEGRHGIR